MQNTETTCEENERVIKKLKTNRSSVSTFATYDSINEPNTSQSNGCLFSKLLELHYEELLRNPEELKNGLKYNSFLLEKLVTRERLNTLILNLYPGNKGYSMAFRNVTRNDQGSDDTANVTETVQWPYEEDDILRHIDREELPPTLVDLFEMHHSELFYNGCIVAEIRDFRQAYPNTKYEVHHVLLRPTLKTILADINNIVELINPTIPRDKIEWGIEERHLLESQILLANNPYICLDPNHSISRSQLRLNHNRNMWNFRKFHRMARKFSQVTVNRKRKLDQFTHRPELELFEFINRVRAKSKAPGATLRIPKVDTKMIPVPNLDPPPISPPTEGVSIKEFKTYPPPVESNDFLPQLVEEYVLETVMPSSKDKNKPRLYHIKVSILQHPSNYEYIGELYLNRDHKDNERNGVRCRFTLGSRLHVNKYLQQFTETFTKNGRQNVRIKQRYNPNYEQQGGVPALFQMQRQQQVRINQTPQEFAAVQNGAVSTVTVNSNLVQNQTFGNVNAVPVLQSHLQAAPSSTSKTIMTNAAAVRKLMDFNPQFQADVLAKQQQERQRLQQQKTSSSANNTIINLLNSSPASNANSDATAAVVNAINSTTILPQQIQTNAVQAQKLTAGGRKMTLMNIQSGNARIIVNNNRFTDLNSHLVNQQQQQQTIKLTSVNNNESFSYTTVPVKQQLINQRSSNTSESHTKQTALSALLVGTPAADRPDIASSNANSLLLEKLAGSSSSNASTASQSFLQSPSKSQQYKIQSPLHNSPPNTNTTINMQSMRLLVSVPVTSSSGTATNSQPNNVALPGPTVVLANASGSTSLVQLVSGMKTLNQQNVRHGAPATFSLVQGQPFQLITSLQAPRLQDSNLTGRTIQRVLMATTSPNPSQLTDLKFENSTQVNVNTNNMNQQPQKQMQLNQYQQLCLKQQQNMAAKRRNSTSNDPQ